MKNLDASGKFICLYWGGGGVLLVEVLLEKLSGVVRPASRNPSPYFRPTLAIFPTLFKTGTKVK